MQTSPIPPNLQSQATCESDLNTSLNLWQLPIFKEAFKALLLSLLGGATITYLVSKLFIRSYLTSIGFDGLVYDALISSDTVSAFSLSIFLIVFSYISTFCFPSIVLRYFYQEAVTLFQPFHDTHEIGIRRFMVTFLFIPPLMLLVLAIFNQNVNWFFVPIFLLAILLFGWIIIHQTNFNSLTGATSIERFSNAIKLIFSSANGQIMGFAIVFAGLLTITFFPFYLMLKTIDNIKASFGLSMIILMIVWCVYSVFYGMRIIERERVEYLIDMAFSLFLLIGTLWYSANTIKVPIAEFAGIKDRSARVYQVPQKDFIDLQKQMVSHWEIKQGSSTCAIKENQKQACYILSATNSLTNDSYLFAQVIFRDGKNSVLCPPDFKLVNDEPSNTNNPSLDYHAQCFLVKSELLTPTALTSSLIKHTGLFDAKDKTLVDKKIVVLETIQ